MFREAQFVNGMEIPGICTNNIDNISDGVKKIKFCTTSYGELLEKPDAVYIISYPQRHYQDIKKH